MRQSDLPRVGRTLLSDHSGRPNQSHPRPHRISKNSASPPSSPWTGPTPSSASIAETSRIAKHAHVPMQSGSDSVLRRMHRKYRPWHYREKIEKIRAAMPTAAIGADVMVGFPGETDAEFAETRRLIEDLPVHLSARLHFLRAARNPRRHDAQPSPGKRSPRPQRNPARTSFRKEARLSCAPSSARI